MPVKIAVGNLKGGTAKTTSAVFVALGLARQGRTLLVDADPQQSAFDWSTLAGDNWPSQLTVIPWATRDLAKRAKEVAADYDHLIIDTGPEDAAILRQALLITEHLLIPVGPSPMELRRLGRTLDLATEVDALSPVYPRVLLTRLRAGTRSSTEAREILNEMEVPMLEVGIRRLEMYSLAMGSVPEDLGEYSAVLSELEAELS